VFDAITQLFTLRVNKVFKKRITEEGYLRTKGQVLKTKVVLQYQIVKVFSRNKTEKQQTFLPLYFMYAIVDIETTGGYASAKRHNRNSYCIARWTKSDRGI
jgi:hypothetical protein